MNKSVRPLEKNDDSSIVSNNMEKKESVFKKIGIYFLKLIFAVIILWLLIRKTDFSSLELSRIQVPWLLLAAACLFLQIALTSVRWNDLLRAAGLHFTRMETLFLTMQGVFFTLFIPGGAVGGDLGKAGIVGKRAPDGQKFNGVFSILIDRICGMIGLFLGTLLCCIFFLPVILKFPVSVQMAV